MAKIVMFGTPPVLTLIEPTHQRHRFIGGPVHKRGIRRNGCRSTLSLEEPFWLALEENRQTRKQDRIGDGCRV